MGWVLGTWRPGESFISMPPSPPGLKLREASDAYLQSLTAYFFPTVTTQIANVMCKRSWKSSLFSRGFLSAARRPRCCKRSPIGAAARRRAGSHRPPRRRTEVAPCAHGWIIAALLVLPARMVWGLSGCDQRRTSSDRAIGVWSARFLDRHYVIFNLFSNPLINLHFFELALCYLFFYTRF
jgi:hypothetical protein